MKGYKIELLQDIFNHTESCICIILSPDGVIQWFNKAAKKAFYPRLAINSNIINLLKKLCPTSILLSYLLKTNFTNKNKTYDFNEKLNKKKSGYINWTLTYIFNSTNLPEAIVIIGETSIKHGIYNECLDANNYINSIADAIPNSVYWKSKDGVYLGCNKAMVTESNLKSKEDIIGKTDFELWPQYAAALQKSDKKVIKTNKTSETEETVQINTGETLYFKSLKTPLIANNETLGVIGVSIDITSQKKAESLKLESELQKYQLQEQEKFKTLVSQVVHDIRSPLASLLMITKSCEKDIPELARITLRDAATSIGDIANSLLNKYRKDDAHISDEAELQPIFVPLVLAQLLTDKKYQYQHLPIKFDIRISQNINFGFINAEPSPFKRMISNLINNAIDAFDSKNGVITIQFFGDEAWTKIIIKDNGKGMPQEVVQKIISGVGVTANKKNGHGLGMVQVYDALQRSCGQLAIDSKVGKGTKITLSFPRIDPPKWFAKEIQLQVNDTVVVLDDDESIHGAWEARLKDYTTAIYVKHFTQANDAINFINTAPSKEKIFLLADFELLKQKLTGLQVIEKTATKRSILVTSHYANQAVRNLASKTNIKILPKQLASEIPIILENKTVGELKSELKKVGGVVIIDDNKMFADALASLFKDKVSGVYYCPYEFLNHLSGYTKDATIFIDYNLSNSMNGLELAKQLHQAGYTRLYILSGQDFEKDEMPEYLNVIAKTDIENVKKIVN